MNLPHEICGVVTSGHKRGKKLGFPTANILIQEKIPEGIYISTVLFDNKKYKALTFIGVAKTYDEKLYQSETFIFDFDEQIYDRELHVKLLKKIRDNERFTTVDALVKQMEDDKMKALEYFKNNEDNK